MGLDDEMLGQWERGWHGSDKSICTRCVGDDYLRDLVARKVVDEQACSFCGAAPAAAFDVFMEAFMVGVSNTFNQADNAGMPWEGGYVFETWQHHELPEAFDWVAAEGHEVEVLDEIRECLVEKTYAAYTLPGEMESDEVFSTAWTKFREQILHRTRFVFWARKDTTERDHGTREVPVAKVLEEIGELLVAFNVIALLPAGTVTYRARGHARREDSQGWGAPQLGTNLPDNATGSTRMSPAGIPLFYGAEDVETALAEVGHADDREFFSVGKFVTTQPVQVIDLTRVPGVPSIFDPKLGASQGGLQFLNDLVDELGRPIKTYRGNLDYVPTQVFCEYFLRVFDEHDVRGLVWKSVAAAAGGCLALDVPQEDCVDVADGTVDRLQLHLVPGSVTVHQRRTDEFRQL